MVAYRNVDESRIVQRLMDYCRIDSAPLKERQLSDAVRRDLINLGLTVTEDDAAAQVGGEAGNLIARLPGRGSLADGPTVMFSAHLDRVEGGIGVQPQLRDGRVVSAGDTILGADDAAGLAAIVEMCTVLQQCDVPHHPLELVLTVGEEIGLVGAGQLQRDQLTASYGYVLDADGPVGAVITQAPARYSVNMVFVGRSAHAGVAPEKGISAVKMAAAAISKMRLGRLDAGTTANVGYIAGGGPTNIVPDRVEIRAETRGLDQNRVKQQADGMVKAAEEAVKELGGRVEAEVTKEYGGFRLDQRSEVVQSAFDAARRIGLSPYAQSTGGGSDANVLNALGIPTAVLAVGYEGIHTFEESMPVNELVRLTQLVCAIAVGGADDVQDGETPSSRVGPEAGDGV